LPGASHGQASPPVVGFLLLGRQGEYPDEIAAVHLAFKQAGLEVGRAVRMEYLYANYQTGELPILAERLVKIPVAAIVTAGGPLPAMAAMKVTTTVPIVFGSSPDPVRGGLVASLNRPGGNVTGVSTLTTELDPKRLELLDELTPARGPIGVLLNPTRPDTRVQLDNIKAASLPIARELVIGYADSAAQIDAAFATFQSRPIVAVLIGADPFFTRQQEQLIALTARHGWPVVQQWPEFAEAGGLAAYGPSRMESFGKAGALAARIVKGEKPADLPVEQVTRFEFVINLRTAKALGLTVPLPLAGRADKIIVLDDGRVIEEGTHETLMRARGRYRDLIEHQKLDIVDPPPEEVTAS
jgi:putative ABC transport system substrate-binding protein